MKPTESDARPGPGLLLLGLGTLALLVFLVLEITGGGFPRLREYELEFLHRLPSGEASFYIRYLALLLPAGLLVALGLSYLVGRRPFENILMRLERMPARMFLSWVALAGAGLVLLVAFLVLRNQPVTDDERVYLFQADILSRGRLFWESDPLKEFFDNVFVINNGRWYGKYPPGHPLLLVPGMALGFPRAIPAILAALNLLLFYGVAREFLSVRASRVAVLLLLVSPFFLFTGATLLSHATTLSALLLFALGSLRSLRGGGFKWWMAAGIGAGFAFLTRPYTALLVGIPIGIAWLVQARRTRASLKPILVAAGVALVFGLAFLGYNMAVTGSPLRTGYDQIQGDRGKVLGFGEIFDGRYTHTPLDGLVNVGLTVVRLNFWSWGWPLGWLFVIAALAWSRDRRLVPLWAILAATGIGSVFYFSMGVADTGPVKFYEILPVLTLITVLGALAFDSRIAAARRPGLSALVPALFVSFTAIGWLFFGRIQATDLRRVTDIIARPYRLVADLEDPRILVFNGEIQRQGTFRSWVFSTPNNLPDYDRAILYVRDRGSRNRELMARMPERIPYLLQVGDDGEYSLTRLSGDEATKRHAEEKVREGILFWRDKKNREAIKSFVEATQIDPGYARAHLLLGWSLEQQGLNDLADQAYRKALELEPQSVDHNFFLGRFLTRRSKFDEAAPLLQKALELSPEPPGSRGRTDIEAALAKARNRDSNL